MAAEKASAGAFADCEKLYDEAMKAFAKNRDFQTAHDLFFRLVSTYGHEHEVSEFVDRARVHLRTCERQLGMTGWQPKNGEEWLLQGVLLSNEGRFGDAVEAYDRALDTGADPAKVHYVKAAALAMSERPDDAIAELRQALAADPETRAFALGDPDFERLREHASFVSLVEPTGGRTPGDH